MVICPKVNKHRCEQLICFPWQNDLELIDVPHLMLAYVSLREGMCKKTWYLIMISVICSKSYSYLCDVTSCNHQIRILMHDPLIILWFLSISLHIYIYPTILMKMGIHPETLTENGDIHGNCPVTIWGYPCSWP